MSNFDELYNNLIDDLENNMKSEQDKKYVINAIKDYLGDLNNEIERKFNILEESQKTMISKFSNLKKKFDRIEEELYIEDDYDEYDSNFEISCPYCNHKFETEIDNFDEDIKCPECNNIIEFEIEEENDGCSSCEGCNIKFNKKEEE